MSTPTTVALVTLGCARNDVDSEELAGRLETDGFELVADPEAAELVLVNTCGFIDAAKKDSVDTLLAAAELKTTEQAATKAVVAVGCMAERYGDEVAAALPEADAILSFDDYPNIAARLRSVLAGETQVTHQPQDRRKLLPISPVARQPEPILQVNGPASGPSLFRKRLDSAPTAPLKLANGCDRRCTFCAIPRFRGAFVSRPAAELLAEAIWLAENGVKELFLVSENSTSYGKDLGDLTALEKLLPELAEVSGIERVRVSYLQPAETRPSLIKAIASTPGVTPYFDWSFQHAATNVLRRMRRFGDPDSFLKLLATARELSPAAGARSNFIVGFPGETDAEYEILRDFIIAAELDAVGVFGYSDEENTEAVALPGKLSEAEISDRVADLVAVADEISAQKAASRIGETVQVLLEAPGEGRAAHQGPEVDGITYLAGNYQIGDLVAATVVDTDGVYLIAEAIQ